ncbi:MAG TPA: hypothetical protein VHE30_00620 [Polyangiaceae bacterium]|nr:hypothetical protein [Polyangiaceae bacterium]
MHRAPRIAILAAVFGVAAVACGGAATSPAKQPGGPVTEREPRRHEHYAPPLIAPPPAYGNKIVMAARETRRSTD